MYCVNNKNKLIKILHPAGYIELRVNIAKWSNTTCKILQIKGEFTTAEKTAVSPTRPLKSLERVCHLFTRSTIIVMSIDRSSKIFFHFKKVFLKCILFVPDGELVLQIIPDLCLVVDRPLLQLPFYYRKTSFCFIKR